MASPQGHIAGNPAPAGIFDMKNVSLLFAFSLVVSCECCDMFAAGNFSLRGRSLSTELAASASPLLSRASVDCDVPPAHAYGVPDDDVVGSNKDLIAKLSGESAAKFLTQQNCPIRDFGQIDPPRELNLKFCLGISGIAIAGQPLRHASPPTLSNLSFDFLKRLVTDR